MVNLEDIKWLREHNESLLQRISLLNRIFTNLDLALFIFDLRRRKHTWTNKKLYRLLGYTHKDISQDGEFISRDLFHPDDRPVFEQGLRDLTAGNKKHCAGIIRLRHREGRWIWIYTDCVVFGCDDRGAPVSVLGVALDILRHLDGTHHFDELRKDLLLSRDGHLLNSLSQREVDVLRLLALGHSSLKIAEQLGISKNTVDTHRRNLSLKLGLKSVAMMTCFAIENGLV
jgi:PAS domain S-box-containing protein